MSGTIPKLVRKCIYCSGTVTKERRGEHILPEAIGGECTLKEVAGKSVCGRCNTGVLSILDRELCNRSHLSMIASQEIEANVWQAWDIDQTAENLLMEAKPYWEEGELKRLVCHPQMVFERVGPQIRGDAEEMERLGKERVVDLMVRAVRHAADRYSAGKKGALHFERVRTDLSSRNYRLPPRVYAPRSLEEIEANVDQSFVFRYLTDDDRAFALESMAALEIGNNQQFNHSSQYIGSRVPPISLYFDAGLVVRALLKIAVNLLAAYCSKTAVNRETFPEVFQLIIGTRHLHPLLVSGNGFVHAVDVAELARPRCHTFRITTLENEWVVYMSFFGGRVGGVVSFPGLNREAWKTMEIVAPIRSKEWTVTTSQLYLPLKVRVEWSDHVAISPSLKLQHAQSRILVEEAPPKKK